MPERMMQLNGTVITCANRGCDSAPLYQAVLVFTNIDAAVTVGWTPKDDDKWVCPVCSKELLGESGMITCTIHDKKFPEGGACLYCENLNVPMSMRIHGLGESDPNNIDARAPGAKLDAGKVQAGVLDQFSRALLAVAEVGTHGAEVGTHGAEKYSRGGWQSVENGVERYGDAGWHHKLKGAYEDLDPDSKLKHKAHEAWNILAELELILREEEK